MSGELDLVVLVADTDAEWTLRTLLSKRTPALQIRPIKFQVIRDPGRDAGVFQRPNTLLRPYVGLAGYALVLIDREGCGQEHLSAEIIEEDLESRLYDAGWKQEQWGRCAAIVLDPELEIWVWSNSPHVASALGLQPDELRDVLADFPPDEQGKPYPPKNAMLAALKQSKRPHSARIFQELAEKVSLKTQERAFSKMQNALQMWFPIVTKE
jgi:hypothetical protein